MIFDLSYNNIELLNKILFGCQLKISKVEFEFFEGENFNVWNINASNKNSKIELILKCPKDEMLLINYEAPNGKKLHNKLWNGGTGFGEIKIFEKRGKENILIDHVEVKNAGCEYGEYK